MRIAPAIAAVSLSLVGCGLNAATHDPTWITTVAGNYKDVEACTLDELRAKGPQPNLSSSVNERSKTARIWDGATTIGSVLTEITFEQSAPDRVQVEYRNAYFNDPKILGVVKGCQSG